MGKGKTKMLVYARGKTRIFINIFLFSYADSNRYAQITKWQNGIDMVNNQNCFALNFGFDQEIPFTTFAFSNNIEVNLDLYTG